MSVNWNKLINTNGKGGGASGIVGANLDSGSKIVSGEGSEADYAQVGGTAAGTAAGAVLGDPVTGAKIGSAAGTIAGMFVGQGDYEQRFIDGLQNDAPSAYAIIEGDITDPAKIRRVADRLLNSPVWTDTSNKWIKNRRPSIEKLGNQFLKLADTLESGGKAQDKRMQAEIALKSLPNQPDLSSTPLPGNDPKNLPDLSIPELAKTAMFYDSIKNNPALKGTQIQTVAVNLLAQTLKEIAERGTTVFEAKSKLYKKLNPAQKQTVEKQAKIVRDNYNDFEQKTDSFLNQNNGSSTGTASIFGNIKTKHIIYGIVGIAVAYVLWKVAIQKEPIKLPKIK